MLTGSPSLAGNAMSSGAVCMMAQDETDPSLKRRGRKSPVKPGKGEAAFDLWLDRGLHKLFDDVANEPLPEEFLRLIEQDRRK